MPKRRLLWQFIPLLLLITLALTLGVNWQAGLAAAMVVAVLVWWFTASVTRPLSEMQDGAERFARGELGYKLAVPMSYELGGLATSLNQMASQLQERINTIVRQSNEQQAVLASMSEGVLAVDDQERLITVNAALCQLLSVDPAKARGRMLREVIRNADLLRFVARALKTRQPIDDVIVVRGDEEIYLQARGAALYDARQEGIGAVIVLNDVTHFRRLEQIRRDFVANVSHELKTPIAAIKGSVETLQDGAIQNAADAERFLAMMARQAERLDAIIEDLLSLSKIEEEERTSALELHFTPLIPVLEAAIHDCEPRGSERGVQIQLSGDESITAPINEPLLGQAVVNLLDNAIKYSSDGGHIQVNLNSVADAVTIAVSDHGCGIPPEHLSRIFERFYRVDKARSRKLGGTGLGLAIVKHIVQAHRGSISVRSVAGAGATFTITLPK
jgi:two-component system phosphate regulon sensor histidine kinase PhoR